VGGGTGVSGSVTVGVCAKEQAHNSSINPSKASPTMIQRPRNNNRQFHSVKHVRGVKDTLTVFWLIENCVSRVAALTRGHDWLMRELLRHDAVPRRQRQNKVIGVERLHIVTVNYKN
jgi:hypothetical protein